MIFSSLLVPRTVGAQEGRGSIVGSVTMEASGKPGADVEVQLAFGSKSISATRPDRIGRGVCCPWGVLCQQRGPRSDDPLGLLADAAHDGAGRLDVAD